MTVHEQIAALQNEPRYQIQHIPDEGNPSAVSDHATPGEAQQQLGPEILDRLKDGFLFGNDPRAGEFPAAVYIHKTTVEMRPVEVVEGHRYQIVERSAWDVLPPEEQDALMVADAIERGDHSFPLEWIHDSKALAAELKRRQPAPATPASKA